MTTKPKGLGLDTRLQSKLLYDGKLQKRLTGDEFRAFINLLVYSVTLVSDGAFDAEETEMIAEPEHIARLTEVGVLNHCEETGLHRIAPAYFDWQTSKAEVQRMAEMRQKDAERKRECRQRGKATQPTSSQWEPVDEMKPEQPF